jgi:hypothetical protein
MSKIIEFARKISLKCETSYGKKEVLARSSPNVMLRYMKHGNKKNMKYNYEQYPTQRRQKLQGKT